jgi:hypothetical protein
MTVIAMPKLERFERPCSASDASLEAVAEAEDADDERD